MRALLMVAVVAALSGCEKAPPAETPPAASAPVATPATPVDSTVQAKADTAPTKAATTAATKAEGPLRDSVIDAKFGVDEKGKVTPLKKP